ncbi:MAG: hypothetical protein AAFV90_04520 [Cyanobacteria bacterium J06634_5]
MNILPTTSSFQSTASDSTASSNLQSGYVLGGDRAAAALLAVLMATGGVALSGQGAMAQTAGNIDYNAATGEVRIDNNAFDIQTGALENESFVPLPASLPEETRERMAQPVIDGKLAPNTIEITPDIEYINEAFNDEIADEAAGTRYTVESVELTTDFDLSQREGSHAYGEGIEITVYDANGEAVSQESTFVRGRRVTVGPDGKPLPQASSLSATYSEDEKVELRVLNLRQNGQDAKESGIYFNADGEFIVEDMQNGGDLDFDDGNYVQITGGRGAAIATEERDEVSEDTVTTEAPLAPEMREEAVIEQDILETVAESDAMTEEERDWGAIETPDTVPTRLGHATGATTDEGEHLVYDQYSGAAQIRAGSDGLGITGQLKPLFNNPNVPPTLLSGNATFNPFVSDNEAGLTGTLSVTQFLNPTHRLAQDAFGNVIENPEGGRPLVEPGGLLNNRRMVGYVPATPEETVMGNQLASVNGIYNLPADQPVMITPADAQRVGPGNAAYTDNVGGLLIEDAAGNFSFMPQWTKAGYEQAPITLAAGEAQRVIYALVPQQAGQTLALGETYGVIEGADGYQIANGGFSIISADRQPQNFVQETSEVYAVEDTVAGQNAVTTLFNGLQGVYAEEVGGPRKQTVDVGLAAEADARVGNTLFPTEVIAAEPGQSAYAQTTRAAGFYLGGSLTGGIGNQRDEVSRTAIEMDRITSELRTRQTVNTYMTPLLQTDSVTTRSTETTRADGRAFFDIARDGTLTNVRFIESDRTQSVIGSDVIDEQRNIVRGEEVLISSETTETIELLSSDMIELDRETTEESESYANFSSVQGEVALGGVLNFGNTPWSDAANTVRAELFARDTVIGRGGNGSEVGWRAEATFHPFGEVQREAYQYDEAGNAVPVYQTEAVRDANGQQVVETLTSPDGQQVDLLVNQFALDANGDRIAQTVGTGEAKGPGIYIRVEDAFDDDEGVVVAGGLQLSF